VSVRGALLALLALAVVAAGCLQSGPTGPSPSESARDAVRAAGSRVLVLEHAVEAGHNLGEIHQGAHNLELVGHSNGVDDSGDPNRIPARGIFNEIALHGDFAFLSRTSADGSFGGFSIVDISDPSQPKVVGQYNALGGSDIEVSDDGRYAFLSTQRNSPDQLLGAARGDAGSQGVLARGLHVVRLDDPSNPVRDTFIPLPTNGPHTITYFRHPNGNEYIVACTYDLTTDPATGAIVGSNPATQRLLVYQLVREEAPVPGLPTVHLVQVAQHQRQAPPSAGLVFPHDAAVDVHAASGRVLITVAYWDLGVRILDFTNPPAPGESSLPALAEVGSFTDFAPSAYNNIHFAKPFPTPLESHDRGLIDVTVAEPEIITADNETGQLTFIDTSDPASPRKVSWWTLPPQDIPLGVRGLDFSPHNFVTFDGKVAVAHYHAGVWVVDVSTPDDLAEPKEVAFYMTAKPRKDSPTLQPNAWSVREKDGLLYVTDEASGLYVLRYLGP
jgi:hypothetical protein